jgi:uncharacterized small protein (DUF1192 family)
MIDVDQGIRGKANIERLKAELKKIQASREEIL